LQGSGRHTTGMWCSSIAAQQCVTCGTSQSYISSSQHASAERSCLLRLWRDTA
jgi:hypothetical protein